MPGNLDDSICSAYSVLLLHLLYYEYLKNDKLIFSVDPKIYIAAMLDRGFLHFLFLAIAKLRNKLQEDLGREEHVLARPGEARVSLEEDILVVLHDHGVPADYRVVGVVHKGLVMSGAHAGASLLDSRQPGPDQTGVHHGEDGRHPVAGGLK